MNTRTSKSEIRIAEIREKLRGERGPEYWRSLEELAETPEFMQMLRREFPTGASEWWDAVSRRGFLKLAAASLALAGVTSCTKQPPHQILPYVRQPEGLVPGEPLFYASAMTLSGFAQGVLVKSYEGHPVKIEGNPDHPITAGGSDVWMQASILDLYDPDRSQGVAKEGEISSWPAFLSELTELTRRHSANRGRGLRFLTGDVTSPTLHAQLNDLLHKFPEARWHAYEPINRDNVYEGSRLAFGSVVETHYKFDWAQVVVSLDSDFLYAHPAHLLHSRQFAKARKIASGQRKMNRLYVAESTPTVTGSMADHRLPVASGRMAELARQLAVASGASEAGGTTISLTEPEQKWLSSAADDLKASRGSALVIAGEWQPPFVHALAHLLNEHLGSVGPVIHYAESAQTLPINHTQSIGELAADMQTGGVETLFIVGGNPAYDAPVELGFSELLQKVKRSIHLSPYLDETSILCSWHVPEAHWLEAWSDGRAYDGTVSIGQPLIAPLYGGKTAHEIFGALVQQQPIRSDYEIVRAYWQKNGKAADFDKAWRKALHDGLISGTANPRKEMRVRLEGIQAALRNFTSPGSATAAVELNLRPDPSIWDGRFANNGWLQECPKPISKLTWDNALYVSPAQAQTQTLANGDVVEVKVGERVIQAPIWIMPGQAADSFTLHLGYGRSRAGQAGNGVGLDSFAIRTSKQPWIIPECAIRRTDAKHELVTTQMHHSLESPERQVYREVALREMLNAPDSVHKSVEIPEREETLYYPGEYETANYKWGMSIDLTTCIGCNACLLACEVENNIPVVGKEQVRRTREMSWIRVDTYFKGSIDNPEFNHQPVPCMHCEHAPCELVCPVEATLHDHEGLNLQVYNRCVGTRFCSNNCPYKVRRFNFFQYAKYREPGYEPMYNPDVTVRWRGVMEKCTYCIQRISRARITAEKENRRIRDGEVVTACQQACPADAIVFGDLSDPNSRVSRLKRSELDYSMLGQLNTRPRTTYLAKVTNRSQEGGPLS